MKIRYQGPIAAPIAKGQQVADLVDHHRRHAAAGRAAGRRRGGRPGRLLRPHLARPQAAVRDGVSATRALHQPRRRGGGRQVDPGRGARRRARAQRGIDVVVTREPGGSEGAEAIRELLLSGDEDRWGAEAEALLFAAARADHVEKTIRPALESGPMGALATASSTARSPIRAARAGSASKRCARSTPSASAMTSPTGPWFSLLDEGGERARARDSDGSDRIGGRPRRLSPQGRAGFPPDRRRGARAGPAGRRLGHARARSRSACSTPSRTCCRDRRPGSRRRAVRERLGDRASCTMPGCSPGPKGVGKASFAHAAARRVLAEAAGPPFDLPGIETADDHPIVRLVEAGSHPDMRWLERLDEREDRQSRPQHQRRPGPRRSASSST